MMISISNNVKKSLSFSEIAQLVKNYQQTRLVPRGYKMVYDGHTLSIDFGR